MKIKEILSQSRRDFVAVFECEHCGQTHQGRGYDDAYFHAEVIPAMKCPHCQEVSPETYRPLATKYPEEQIV